ncbi:hypothetical protein VTJ49DRAFT_4260 [Mycothermus thermophilus]|uniref:Uncharacterized protein n=1 Tax=Humicola insolens TaxID=85995 RepID=A0ABR3VLK5_HUMIN
MTLATVPFLCFLLVISPAAARPCAHRSRYSSRPTSVTPVSNTLPLFKTANGDPYDANSFDFWNPTTQSTTTPSLPGSSIGATVDAQTSVTLIGETSPPFNTTTGYPTYLNSFNSFTVTSFSSWGPTTSGTVTVTISSPSTNGTDDTQTDTTPVSDDSPPFDATNEDPTTSSNPGSWNPTSPGSTTVTLSATSTSPTADTQTFVTPVSGTPPSFSTTTTEHPEDLTFWHPASVTPVSDTPPSFSTTPTGDPEDFISWNPTPSDTTAITPVSHIPPSFNTTTTEDPKDLTSWRPASVMPASDVPPSFGTTTTRDHNDLTSWNSATLDPATTPDSTTDTLSTLSTSPTTDTQTSVTLVSNIPPPFSITAGDPKDISWNPTTLDTTAVTFSASDSTTITPYTPDLTTVTLSTTVTLTTTVTFSTPGTIASADTSTSVMLASHSPPPVSDSHPPFNATNEDPGDLTSWNLTTGGLTTVTFSGPGTSTANVQTSVTVVSDILPSFSVTNEDPIDISSWNPTTLDTTAITPSASSTPNSTSVTLSAPSTSVMADAQTSTTPDTPPPLNATNEDTIDTTSSDPSTSDTTPATLSSPSTSATVATSTTESLLPNYDTPVQLKVSNACGESIWPGILTQSGISPGTSGFELTPGASKVMFVSDNWAGRIWGRTNCSFNEDGTGPSTSAGVNGYGAACLTGDCGGRLDCQLAGQVPTTLAEFNLRGGANHDQTFYDISLVDGYNLPLAIVYHPDANTVWIPPSLTNAACIASSAFLTSVSEADQGSLYSHDQTYPMPYELDETAASLSTWCPFSLLKLPQPLSASPENYPPDDAENRPAFQPCLSPCSATGSPADCCTGDYNSPDICRPSDYSRRAKHACPDAYSFAYDDHASTFVVPSIVGGVGNGAGWEVVFCPRGRSTDILGTFGKELGIVGARGTLSPEVLERLRDRGFVEAAVARAREGILMSGTEMVLESS